MTEYVRSYSNYIKRNNPVAVEMGYAFENDLLTTFEEFNTVDNNMTYTTEGGFTFITNVEPDDSKTYNTNGWNHQRFTLNDTILTVDDFQRINTEKTTLKEKKYIDLNRFYDNIVDLCYFGSCNEYFKATFNDIVERFPAGMYVDNVGLITIDNDKFSINYEEIENFFSIDILDYTDQRINLNYDLRVFGSSFSDFEMILSDETTIGSVIGFTGLTIDNTTTLTFQINTPITGTTSGFHIRPIISKQDEFYNSLDDFQKILLNRNTVPKFRSSLKIPVETNNGVSFEYTDFVWPTTDGYNIDISSTSYSIFANQLITASLLVDELYADNVYRMLTHDTIKNMDSTYGREEDAELLDDIIVGTTKIQSLLRIYGRSFDELKKYIEGISVVNNITYDAKNNLPKELFPNRLNTSGWDAFSLLNIINETGKTSEFIYPSYMGSYSVKEVNDEILRRLIINSKYITRSKGTRKSIRKIMGMFGIDETWYELREYVQLIDNFIIGTDLENIARLNYAVNTNTTNTVDNNPDFVYSYDETLYDGINTGIFIKCPTCGSENYFVDPENPTSGTCVENLHIFELTGATVGYSKPRPNDNNYYFQGNGYWYRETGGVHTDVSGNTYVTEISYGNNPHIGNGEYDNGYDYIDQFPLLFKEYLRTDSNILTNVEDYDNVGFGLSNKKLVDNKKVWFNTNLDRNYDIPTNLIDDRLILNLKNVVLGINGDKVMQSFVYKNNLINKELLVGSGVNYTVSADTPSLVVLTSSGATDVTITLPSLAANKSIKFHYDIESTNLAPITVVDHPSVILERGKTIICVYDLGTDTWTVEKYYGEDEYELIRQLVLPYLEQIIPATTLFEFQLIKNDKPKWILVENYNEKGNTGYYNGNKVISFQNMNYFDTSSTWENSADDLNQLIIDNFGSGFIFYKMKSNFETYLVAEDGKYILTENGFLIKIRVDKDTTFDNVVSYIKTGSYNVNIEPDWIIAEDINLT